MSSTDPALKGVEVQFQPFPRQQGAFLAHLQGGKFVATQLWIFRPDGTAAVREAPDLGEQQPRCSHG